MNHRQKARHFSLFHYITIAAVVFIFAVLVMSRKDRQEAQTEGQVPRQEEKISEEYLFESSIEEPAAEQDEAPESREIVTEQAAQELRNETVAQVLPQHEAPVAPAAEKTGEPVLTAGLVSPELGESLKRQWRGERVSAAPPAQEEKGPAFTFSPPTKQPFTFSGLTGSAGPQAALDAMGSFKGFSLGGLCSGVCSKINILISWLPDEGRPSGVILIPNLIKCDYRENRARCWIVAGALDETEYVPARNTEPFAIIEAAKVDDSEYEDITSQDSGTLDFSSRVIVGMDEDDFLEPGTVMVIKTEQELYYKVKIIQCFDMDKGGYAGLDFPYQIGDEHLEQGLNWRHFLLRAEWEQLHKDDEAVVK